MREIKFEILIRRKDGAGEPYSEILTLDDLINRNGSLFHPNIWEVVYKRQYTGLRDKNGKEIYEGDIVKISQGSIAATSSVYEVIFEFGAFQMKKYPEPENDYRNTAFITYAVQCSQNLLGTQDLETVQTYLEVIGNIYQNPELLKP